MNTVRTEVIFLVGCALQALSQSMTVALVSMVQLCQLGGMVVGCYGFPVVFYSAVPLGGGWW